MSNDVHSDTMHIDKDELEKKAQEVLADIKDKIPGQDFSPKDRLAIPLQEMPAQDPKARATKMSEVALGYTETMAQVEANRCLQCKGAPCVKACPVGVPIPQFISHVAQGNFKDAVD